MRKVAQQPHQHPMDTFTGQIAGQLATPIGWGAGLLAARHLWKGSPMFQTAAMVGLPYALYQYSHYSNPANLLQAQANSNEDLLKNLEGMGNSRFIDPNTINHIQQVRARQLAEQYNSPGRTALSKALPAFAVGAALPAALRMFSR